MKNIVAGIETSKKNKIIGCCEAVISRRLVNDTRAGRKPFMVLIAAVILSLSACGGGDTLPLPSEDAFYIPPIPLPPGSPGDIIKSRSTTYGVADNSAHNMWQVMYRSTDTSGVPVAITGSVIVPSEPWAGTGLRPVVSYAVGTRGLGDNCAPSYTLADGFDYERGFINNLLDEGWAVVVTDYQGLGTPGAHTYIVGPVMGSAVLDMARAAMNLAEADLDSNAPIGILGYSEGGGAAGWAAQMAGTYAPELNLVGTAAGGVPGNLQRVGEFLDGKLAFPFLLFAAVGLDEAFSDLNLFSYLNSDGKELLEKAKDPDTCLTRVDGLGLFLGNVFKSMEAYTTTDVLNTPTWLARLEEIKLGKSAPSAPVFQYHALFDEIIPLDQAKELRESWCSLGGDIYWKTLLGEHALGILQGAGPSRKWLKDRFDGVSNESNCP
ncbi:MAG: triacylglycerol lipase [Moraxellaceae bacterium]|nr:MAG: triacylglycerol lipase [Moraxellaceae bacterium]